MAAGSIIVDLLMRTGSFVTDTGRAEKSLRSLSREARATAAAFKGSFAGNVLADVAQQVTRALYQLPGILVDTAAAFQDLSEETGAGAADLASFAVSAAASGVTMDSIGSAINRLTKGLVGVDDESKDAGAAIKALGLNIDQFKKLDPAAQYEAIGRALNGFADGAGKTAVAMALFGKAGAEQLKVFKALEEAGGRQYILTQKQIEQADAFADRQAKSSAQLKLYASILVVETLPAITALQNALVGVAKELINTGTESDRLGRTNPIRDFAETAALAIGRLIDELLNAKTEISAFAASTSKEFANIKFGAQLASANPADLGDFVLRQKGPLQAAFEERNKVAADADKAFAENANKNGTRIQDALRKQFTQQRLGLTGERLDAKTDPRSLVFGKGLPELNFKGAAKDPSSKDDPTKKLLENDLKDIENLVRREQDLLASRNKLLDIFNDRGLLSIRSYYDAQRVILESATSSQIALYDKEIAALREYQNKKTTSKKDSADAQGKINELLEKQVRLEQEAGLKGIELGIKQSQAQKDLAREVANVNVQLLEMQGRFAEAADIRFRQQNAALVLRLEVEGDQEALAKIEKLRVAAVDQAKFTEEAINSDRALQRLGITSETIALKQQAGALSELDALRELGVARQASIVELEGIVTAQEAIAKASGDNGLVLQAQRARLELEKLKAVADPLSQKFTELFEDSFADNLASFANGTKTAKQAFKDFANSISTEINRMLAKDFAKSLFGKDGIFGGAGKAAGSIFSSKGIFSGLAGPGPETGAGESGGVPNDILKDLGIGAAGQAASSAAFGASITASQAASTASITAAITASGATSTAAITTAITTSDITLGATLSTAIAGSTTAIVAAISAQSTASESSLLNAFGFTDLDFADGGFTGYGGKYEPAGVVHRGEVVWSQSDVMRAGGPAVVDAMRKGMSGYADGGIVPQTYGLPPPVTNTNTRSREGDTIISPTIYVQGAANRDTADQIGSEIARQVMRARTRNTAGVTR